ncbi:MAG: dTDP-4-dehydrorhamnose reductase, partial [Gammaproteobacteria bacterium]
SQLDLEDTRSIKPFLENTSPDLIINAAAYTAVDKAEEEPEKAEVINARAPGLIAEYAAGANIPIIHYSTDYVFDGCSQTPYTETDPVSPQSVYGKTKLQGEELVVNSGADFLILRTSWVYGLHGNNFLLTMLRLFRERDELGIVDDQIGAPTSSNAIAHATAQIIDSLGADISLAEHSGIYHLTATGQTSWYGFASAILKSVEKDGYQCKLKPILTEQYPTPAARPAYSVLDNSKLNSTFNIQLPSWEQQLASVMQKWHEKV